MFAQAAKWLYLQNDSFVTTFFYGDEKTPHPHKTNTPENLVKRRSIGLIITSILLIISSLPFISYFRPLLSPEFRNVMSGVMSSDFNMNFTALSYTVLCVWGILGAAGRFISAVLILALKEAGRKLAIWVSSITIIGTLAWTTYHTTRESDMSMVLISAVMFFGLNIALIFFFTRQKVIEQFRQI